MYKGHRSTQTTAKEIDYCYAHEYLPRFSTEVPGSKAFISRLRGRGIKTGIVTNGTRLMLNTYLRTFDVNVDAALSADDVSKPKPDPCGIRTVLEFLDTRPDEALYIGDSSTDIAAGKAAHVITVGVLSGIGTREELQRAGADFVVGSVSDLRFIVRKLYGGS